MKLMAIMKARFITKSDKTSRRNENLINLPQLK